MSEWSTLPNAAHIDWVINTTRRYPQIWSTALDVSLSLNRQPAHDEAYAAAMDANLDIIWYATMVANRVPKSIGHSSLAHGAILALIVYNDCDQYLSMTSEELRLWATLSEHPAAILLLPVVLIREKMAELALL